MVTVQSLLEPVIGHYRRLSNSYHSCIIIWVHLISSVWIKLHIHQLRPIQQSRQKVLWSCCPKIILCLELLVSLCCNKGIFPLIGSRWLTFTKFTKYFDVLYCLFYSQYCLEFLVSLSGNKGIFPLTRQD